MFARLSAVLATLLAVPAVAAASPSGAGLTYPPGTPKAATGQIASDFWMPVLETAIDHPDHPFNTGGCRIYDGIAFDYGWADCVVPAGTPIFEVGFATECSTAEEPPYHAESEAEAIACARAEQDGITQLEMDIDGRTLDLLAPSTELLMPWRTAVFGDPTVFGATPGPAMFGGVTRGVVLRPLSVGRHHVVNRLSGAFPDGTELVEDEISWDIVVTPRR